MVQLSPHLRSGHGGVNRDDLRRVPHHHRVLVLCTPGPSRPVSAGPSGLGANVICDRTDTRIQNHHHHLLPFGFLSFSSPHSLIFCAELTMCGAWVEACRTVAMKAEPRLGAELVTYWDGWPPWEWQWAVVEHFC